MKPKVVTTAAVVVIAAGAFLAGRSSVSTEASAATESSATTARAGSSSRLSGALSSSASRAEHKKGEGRTAGSSERPATKEARLAKLESIMRGQDPLARNRALLDYIDQLDPSEMKDAVDRFRSMGITQDRFGEYAMMLTAWSKADPMAALDYAKANTKGGFATNTILTNWASTDPEAAIAWAKANHDASQGENPYMAGIIKGIADTDPARATGLLTGMAMSTERGDALNAILPSILAQGTDATREWVASIEDEHLRNGAMEKVVDQLAEKDPKGTADWLAANPGEGTNNNMDNVLSAWMAKDAAAATAYYQSLPAGDTRSNAMRGIVNTLADENPQAAADFLNSHTADITDRVTQQFVWHSMGSDPALAVSYISKISDQGARDGMYRRTLDNWMRTDEPAARTYLQTHPMPDSMQGYVQKRLGK